MSDHIHASNVQGSNKEPEESYGCREETRITRKYMEKQKENIDKKFGDIKDLINQLFINQNKGKRHRKEEYNHRRKNSHDSKSQSERV